MWCNNLFVINQWSSYGQRYFRKDPYETDEGGDVRPTVLHEWIRAISYHVCDVFVETLRTFRNRIVSKVSLNYIVHVKTVLFEFTDRTPSQCWLTGRGKGGVGWCHCRRDGPTAGASTSLPINKKRKYVNETWRYYDGEKSVLQTSVTSESPIKQQMLQIANRSSSRLQPCRRKFGNRSTSDVIKHSRPTNWKESEIWSESVVLCWFSKFYPPVLAGTWLSSPSKMTIEKKHTDHRWGMGIMATARG